MTFDPDTLAWDKMEGLLPAIVQDVATGEVRMLGYMDRSALDATRDTGKVTFFSRSKGRLWVKGETSGNTLEVDAIRPDCDGDTLLVTARPRGPTCHKGTDSCFGEGLESTAGFLPLLARIVAERAASGEGESYTRHLLDAGVKRIAQKVGEEGVEVALAATAGDSEEVASEMADLLYHLTVLLEATGSDWEAVMSVLRDRHER